jgi:hypothetical protein
VLLHPATLRPNICARCRFLHGLAPGEQFYIRKTNIIAFRNALVLSFPGLIHAGQQCADFRVAQKDFNGRQVLVSGALRTFATPRHYWIENDALDRVALEGAIDLQPLVGQTVKVRGMFHYDSKAGRRIEVDELVADQ